MAATAELGGRGLDCWLTTGDSRKEFERRFARFFGVRGCSLVNSGSSANLVAFSALTSPKLGDRRLKPGDEVITLAAGFPTTVNPIIQNQCVPVFIDIALPTYQLDAQQLESALSDRTRAIMFAHTWATSATSTRWSTSLRSTIFGLSKTVVTLWVPPTKAGWSELLATLRP